MKKVCNKCKQEKDEELFSFRNKAKGIRLGHCKSCHSEYVKTHYGNNKDAYKSRAKRDYKKTRQKFVDFVRSLKIQCAMCGEKHPAVLDFHHTDPSVKEASISMLRNRQKVLQEIEKCVVLCSNCHRILHWNEHNQILGE